MAKKGAPSKFKAVTRYDKQGNKKTCYPSIKAASGKTGILISVIANAARGNTISAGGYLWRYGNGSAKIETSNLTRKMDDYLARTSKPVTQYDLKGKVVAWYSSIREASRATGFNHSAISACLHRRMKTAHGFVWREGYGKEKIKLGFKPFRIKVIQHTLRSRKTREFPTVLSAAKETGIPYHQIRGAMVNGEPLSGCL